MTTHLPALGPAEAKGLDRIAEEEFHVPLGLMMENAGRSFAAFARRVSGLARARALVLVGKGGNGGGALAAARHLVNAGWEVEVALAVPPETLIPASWLQHEMVKGAGAIVRDGRTEPVGFERADVVLDGLLGYNARGEPRPPMDALLARANAAPGRRLALDIPTGVDPESGRANGEPFRAEATLMLALPKRGTVTPEGRAFAGELWLGDVGFPAGAYARVGGARPPFDEAGLHRFG